MENFKNSLDEFKGKVNDNKQVKKLIRGWNPNLILECIDDSAFWTIKVKDREIQEIVNLKEDKSHMVHVQGNTDVLEQIFSGKLNPSEALLDGKIAVFGDEKDQIKIDAICLILWS